MSRQSKHVTFELTCAQERAWLVLTSKDRTPHVVEMFQKVPGAWSAGADLPPGEYHCRYYCGDDRNVNYYGAASVAGSTDCGMDALVSIV